MLKLKYFDNNFKIFDLFQYQTDIEKMVKNKESKSNIRIIANSLVKNNRTVIKYNRLDA